MALSPVQLVALINANIRENNRKAITGKSMNMVLNEMVNTIDSSTAVDSNVMTEDLTATGNRNQNLGGYSMRFHSGKFILGNDLSLPYLLQINGAGASLSGAIAVSSGAVAFNGSDTTGRGVVGTTASGVGVDAVATSTGIALRATRNSGMSGQFVGKVLVEPADTLTNDDSAIFEVNSTELGSLPAPRMTQSEINALGLTTEALLVYNKTRSRYEFKNPSFFEGMSHRYLNILFSTWNPQDSQTVAFGQAAGTPQLTSISPAPYEIIMRDSGVIRGCDFSTFTAGTVGTNEAWSLYVRHNGTDYLVATVSNISITKVFRNQSLNIPYVPGDIVRMVMVNPAWSTNPTNVSGGGHLNLQ